MKLTLRRKRKNRLIELLKIKSFKFNLSWLVFDKIFRASLNIIVTIIIARNLGPENFGVLSYLLVLVFFSLQFQP